MNKVIMKLKCNGIDWNPRQPSNFTAANEDGKLYTFDMRFLNTAKLVHKDHLNAVMDVKYSPTGREFVTGSYDKTIRIFKSDQSKSKDVYFTRRM